VEGALARRVAEAVEGGPVQARAGVALVGEDVLGSERVARRLHPLTEGSQLPLNRLIALLAAGRDAGVDRCTHGRTSREEEHPPRRAAGTCRARAGRLARRAAGRPGGGRRWKEPAIPGHAEWERGGAS